MTAFPDAFVPGINSEADPETEAPDADEPVKMTARGGKSGGHGISIVVDLHRDVDAHIPERIGQRFADVGALELPQVGGLFDKTVANDAGKSDADDIYLGVGGESMDLARDALRDARQRSTEKRLRFGPFFVNTQRTDQAIPFHQAGGDMLCGSDSDGFHFDSQGRAPRHSKLGKLVQAVKRRGLVTFSQRRVIENSIDKI